MLALLQGERIEELKRGSLYIIQNAGLPRFSMDAVLLSMFTEVSPCQRVADLGTGTGIIPLLLVDRDESVSVTAVEIIPELAGMARRSMALNNFSGRVEVLTGDLRDPLILPRQLFDVVVSNPPYYEKDSCRLSGDPVRAAARSELYCTLAEVVSTAAALLNGGSFYLAQRYERLSEAVALGALHGLYPRKLRRVRSFAGDEPYLFLLCLSSVPDETVRVEEDDLCIFSAAGVYSPELQAIYDTANRTLLKQSFGSTGVIRTIPD